MRKKQTMSWEIPVDSWRDIEDLDDYANEFELLNIQLDVMGMRDSYEF